MDILFLLSFIISFLIFITILIELIRNYEDKSRNKLLICLFILGLGYLIISILFLIWALNFLAYAKEDLKLIYTILIISKSFILGGFTYIFTRNKSIPPLFSGYTLLLILMFFLKSQALIVSMIISFIFIASLFWIIRSSNEKCKRISWLGILYAVVALIFQILLNFNIGNKIFFFILSTTLFLVWFFLFLKKMKECPQKIEEKAPKRESLYVVSFLKNFVFIIIFSVFILVGTIGLHELGHFAVSKAYACEYSSIIYSQDLAYTKMLCEGSNRTFLILGGIFLPIILALILFAISNKIIKEAAYLIIGFGLISAYKDFEELGLNPNGKIVLMILGAVFIAVGIALLSKSKIEE
jgi:hypothetical protein